MKRFIRYAISTLALIWLQPVLFILYFKKNRIDLYQFVFTSSASRI